MESNLSGKYKKLKTNMQIHDQSDERLRKKKEKVIKFIKSRFWGDDPNAYNYCSETIFGTGPLNFDN
jgi:hypothetical protein